MLTPAPKVEDSQMARDCWLQQSLPKSWTSEALDEDIAGSVQPLFAKDAMLPTSLWFRAALLQTSFHPLSQSR